MHKKHRTHGQTTCARYINATPVGRWRWQRAVGPRVWRHCGRFAIKVLETFIRTALCRFAKLALCCASSRGWRAGESSQRCASTWPRSRVTTISRSKMTMKSWWHCIVVILWCAKNEACKWQAEKRLCGSAQCLHICICMCVHKR